MILGRRPDIFLLVIIFDCFTVTLKVYQGLLNYIEK